MEVKLEELLVSIGDSVQKARRALEDEAMELYFRGYQREDGDTYVPIRRKISLPITGAPGTSSKLLEVPVTALYHHNSMALDTVDIRLNFIPVQEKEGLTLELQPQSQGEPGLSCSQLSLCFKREETPEGMARVNDHSVKILS